MSWNPAVLEFIELTNLNNLPDLSINNFLLPAMADSGLLFAWVDNTAQGITLLDETALFTINFKVIGNQGAVTEIDIGDKLFLQAEAETIFNLLFLNIQKGIVQVKSSPMIIPEIQTLVIPTFNQWSLLIFGLLVLNVGLVLIHQKFKRDN